MIVFKIILWILLVVLVIAVTALCIQTGIVVEYKDETVLKIRYLFLTIQLAPKKEKKKKQNKKKKDSDKAKGESPEGLSDEHKSDEEKKSKKKKAVNENEEKEPSAFSRIKDLYKEKGLDGFIRIIKEISKLAGSAGKSVFKGITLKKLNVNIAVSTGDAAETAIKYGYVCAGVYPALAVLLSSVRFKDYSVDIKPDFDNDEPVVHCLAEISIIPWVAVGIALRSLFRFIILKIKGIL